MVGMTSFVLVEHYKQAGDPLLQRRRRRKSKTGM
jgi:hypothetical protein